MSEPPITSGRKWSEVEEVPAEISEPTPKDSCFLICCAWGVPLVVVPLIVAFPLIVASFNMVWPLSLVLVLGFLTWIGRTCLSGSDSEAVPSWGNVALYVVVQVIWIPLFWSAIFWCLCGLIVGNFK
jgi:hypothetical protein